MTMSYQNEEDYFNYTNRTGMILEGLGIGHLIPQFKKRNISTQELSQMPKEDFITLGADEEVIVDVMKQLGSRVNTKKLNVISSEEKSQQFIDIIKNGNQQLLYIQAFIKYTRLRLMQEPIDYIIDTNRNERASEALCIVANCAIKEMNHFEQQLKELSAHICEDARGKRLKKFTLTLISGIGLSVGLMYSWRYTMGLIKSC